MADILKGGGRQVRQNCKICSARHDRSICPYCGGKEDGLGAVLHDHYEAVIIGGPGFFVKIVTGLMKHAFNAGVVAGHEGRPMTGPVWEEYVTDPQFANGGLDEYVNPTTGPKKPELVPVEELFDAFQKFQSGIQRANSEGLWRRPIAWEQTMTGLRQEFKDRVPTLAGLIDWDDRSSNQSTGPALAGLIDRNDRSGDRPVQSTGPADDRSSEC